MTTIHLPDTVRTGGIVLPPSVRNEIEGERQETLDNLYAIKALKSEYEPGLKDIDPYLELLKAKDQTTVIGLKAGYWHIIRMNPGCVPDILPLEHADGSYREPGSWIYDFVMECDFWNDRSRKAKKRAAARAADSRERQKERERQDRVGEIANRINSNENTQILVRRNI